MTVTTYTTLHSILDSHKRPTAVRRADDPITVHVARTTEDLEMLTPAWTELRARFGWPTPNNDPRLYAATLEAFGDRAQPEVILFRSAAGPRAIIIARRSLRPTRFRLGYWSIRSPRMHCLDVVYGGLITDGTTASRAEVRDHLRGLLESGEVDHIMINHLARSHELHEQLTDRRRFPHCGPHDADETHWRFVMPSGTFENTLGRFSRKHRYNIKRADRMLVDRFEGDVHLECVDTEDGLHGFIRDARRVTGESYLGAIGGGFGTSDVLPRLLAAAAVSGDLRSYVLRAGGEPIAFQTGVTCAGVYHLLSTAFLPRLSTLSPGQVLLLRVLEDLCSSGIRAVDYGFGDSPYKRMYGTESRDETTLHLYSQTARARTVRRLHRFTDRVHQLGAHLLEYSGLSGKIKTSWRSRLTRKRSRAHARISKT